MSTSPRHIKEYLEPLYTDNKQEQNQEEHEDPVFVQHMISLPLTNGKTFEVDPKAIVSVDEHRADQGVTVLRVKNDSFTYFVARPKSVVLSWLDSRR